MNSMPDIQTTPEMGLVMGAMTVLFVLCFVGWGVWAWMPRNRSNMEAAARLPLEE